MTGDGKRGGRRGPAATLAAALAVGFFRLAYRLFPASHRGRTQAEAEDSFRRGFAARRSASGRAAAWWYAWRSAVDTAATAWKARRQGWFAGPSSGLRRLRETRLPGARPRGFGARDTGVRGHATRESGLLTGLAGDVRYAFRRLGRSPGFAGATILILALGVGANAAVFSALETAFLEAPPYPSPEELVFPSLTVLRGEEERSLWSYPRFRAFREATGEAFRGLVGYASRSAAWTHPGAAEQVAYELVTPGYFELLGAVPAVGRFFSSEEEGATAPPGVVVLSHDTWTGRFGGDPSVVERSATIDGERVRVVGVAGSGFRGLTGDPAFWVPMGHARAVMGGWTLENPDAHWFHAVARLVTGVSREQALARVEAKGRAIGLDGGPLEEGERLEVRVRAFRDVWSNAATRTSLWLLAVGAGLVLLIAIANLASLLLARGRREARETAVRLALGAGRGRLLRERLVESLVLTVLGGAGGVVLAGWAITGIRTLWPARLQSGAGADVRWIDPATLSVDAHVVAVGFGLATVAALVFAALPTLLGDSRRLMGTLRQAGGSVGRGGRSGASTRGWLLGGQFAFSVALLVVAGLLGTTLFRLHQEQRGFDPEGLLTVSYTFAGRPAASAPDALAQAHGAFRRRVETIPGVRSAALGTSPPLSGHPITVRVSEVVGGRVYREDQEPEIGVHSVSDGYFRTLGTPVVRGRTFAEAEYTASGPIVVINQTAAERLFPGEDPVGRRIRMGFSTDVVDPDDPSWTVVGVVDDILYSRPADGMMPEAYVPYGAWSGQSYASLFVRTEGDPARLLTAVQAAMEEIDPDVPFWRTATGPQLRTRGVADTRVLVFVLVLFAGLAVVLSAAGVWAIVAQAVAERRREIGVRIALGAVATQVEGLVVRQGAVPLLVGGAAGLTLAALGARSLTGLLFRTEAHDPLVFGGAALVLAGVWLLASWLPARRAARVDPVEALSAD